MRPWGIIPKKQDLKTNKLMVPVGKVSGVLYTILGLSGAIGLGAPITIMLILGYAIGAKAVFHTIAWGLLPLLIISIVFLISGNRIRSRLKRFERYKKRLNNRYYCLITELSAPGQTRKATIKDLQKMINVGMFPEGHLDEQEVYFMLNDGCYEEYLKLQQSAKLKMLEEKNNQKNNQKQLLTLEEKKIIDQGRGLIRQIKKANEGIPGKDLSSKLDKLEIISQTVFEYVEHHPEKLSQIKRFTEYFLPTTLKLADTYVKLDKQPVQGDNILNAKKDIEKTMDTIYDAFENLLDGLFEDIALDVSTDISVLETIFAQEGLTQNPMNFKNEIMEDNNEQ